MRNIQRVLACLLCLLLCMGAAGAEEGDLGYQDAHRFTLDYQETKRYDGALTKLWYIETANETVTAELNAIAQAYADELTPTLKRPQSSVSRLTVSIIPSRTGLTWMSFMVQARNVFEEHTEDVAFTTRTYDMVTGERVLLTDVFPADSEAWDVLETAVREGVAAYWPDVAPDAAALEAACTREAIEQMDFTLRGASLVLHLNAADFYDGKHQLLEIPLYYPQIRQYMSEKAAVETDNQSYYKMVALTFDDGPNGWATGQVLDVLIRTGTPATFFLVGDRITQQAYLVQREHDEGHAIASHCYEHIYANVAPMSQLKVQREKADKVHIAAIGQAPRYARAPGGFWKGLAEAEQGWPLIQWSVQAEDWRGESGPDPRETSGNIVAGTDNGGIILLHDVMRNTTEATRLIVERLWDEGYMFVTVDELFAREGVTLEGDQGYYRCIDGYTGE